MLVSSCELVGTDDLFHKSIVKSKRADKIFIDNLRHGKSFLDGTKWSPEEERLEFSKVEMSRAGNDSRVESDGCSFKGPEFRSQQALRTAHNPC